MLARTIRTYRMADVPVGWRVRMRELSLGPLPDGWGSWSWTFHNGSCWAALGFVNDNELVAWAGLTEEVDTLPVVAVFVEELHRGSGLAAELLTSLLRGLLVAGDISVGDRIYASTGRWGRYEIVMDELGLECVTWV